MAPGEEADNELPVSPELELQAAIIQERNSVAVKSEPLKPVTTQQKSFKELSSLGVGTFSIDENTAKNMVSGRFVKRIKIKRCGKCNVSFFNLFLHFSSVFLLEPGPLYCEMALCKNT